jgi:hypothetical protein
MGVSYNPSVVTDGLVLYIDAANTRSYSGSGNTVYDVSLLGNSGALTAITYSGTGGSSVFIFDGLTSLINLGNGNGLNVTTAWTCEAWIRPVGYGENNAGRIFQHSTGSLTGFIFSLDNSAVTAGLQINTYAISGFSARLGNCVTLNTWQQVVLAFSPGTASFYVNGASIGSSSITSPSSYTSTNYIGNNSGATNTFDGSIGIVRLYNNTLSASQILQNYNTTKGRYRL